MSDGTATTLQAPASGVTIRMYRQGLGDCFLLAFATGVPDKSYYVLIDCGVLLGTQDAEATMTRVAEDIEAATAGDIHLLIATHRHWDHISGFTQAAAVFQRMRIHNLWLSWAEDPKDPLGRELWGKSQQALVGLRRAVGIAGKQGALGHVASVLDFVGDVALSGDADPLQNVRQLATNSAGQIAYRQPGDGPLPLPTAPGLTAVPSVRLYVLGPPRDTRALAQMDPTKCGQETYLTSEGLDAQLAFLLAVTDDSDLTNEQRLLRVLSYPFEENVRIPRSDAAQYEFFHKNYGFDDAGNPAPKPAAKSGGTAAEGPAWRRIDDEWLGTSEELALQLDNCINNTTLALAIELPDTGKVLLFAGDAQVGNWLSWYDLVWTVPGQGGAVQIKAGNLLARTVLYKVGHHGSHNATVRAHGTDKWGLELMTSPQLVALLPVDEEMAKKPPRGWQMPCAPLLARLDELTGMRALRADTGVPQSGPAMSGDDQWPVFLAQTAQDALYVQFTLPG
jgi:hypothetical protein